MSRIITLTANPALDVSVETDEVLPNQKLRCDHPQIDPGGGGVNVARAAKRLGSEVLAIFPAGGAFGEALTSLIEKEGIACRAISVEGPTRIAFTAHDRASNNEYRFGLPGVELGDSELAALLAALGSETRKGDYVVGSGSLPPKTPADFWARAAAIAKAKGARFVLDTTSGEKEALYEGLFLLRKNKQELSTIAGRVLRWPDEAASFARDFVQTHKLEKLVLTHGGDGGMIASKSGCVTAPSIPVTVASAVGAGDSMVAGLVVSLMRGDDDDTALRWGLAAAAATLMTPGTTLFDAAEVTRLSDDALLFSKEDAAAPYKPKV